MFSAFWPPCLYRWGDALDWAEKRLSPIVASTSEVDAACHATARRMAAGRAALRGFGNRT